MTVGIAVATTVASSAAMKTHSTSARTVRERFARRAELEDGIDAPEDALPLPDLEQLDLEDERRIRRDDRRVTVFAVRKVRRDRQFAQRADLHPGDPLVPPLDHATAAEREC